MQRGERRADNHRDDVAADLPAGDSMRRTVWYHEDDKGRGCNGYDDRGPEHYVNDQEDYQQRERGQSTLEEIVLPTAAKPSIDQPPFE